MNSRATLVIRAQAQGRIRPAHLAPRRRNGSAKAGFRMVRGATSCKARHEKHDLRDSGPLLVLRQRLPIGGASSPRAPKIGPRMSYQDEAGFTESRALSRTSS